MMNQNLKTLLDFIQQAESLTPEDKNSYAKKLKDIDQELTIAEFKLERTEKVKRTISTLLEETIAELEQKRKAVEAQNRELEIESSLERVRTKAMGISKPDDLLDICEIMFIELQNMGFNELRNSMINIHDDVNRILLNYDYSHAMGKSINHLLYGIHPVVEMQVRQMKSGKDAFSETIFTGKDLESWREMRRAAGEKDDPRIENISALYYYFYSIGTGFIGISTFSSISEEKRSVLKRFRNVFDLAYRRYIDVTLAIARAKDAVRQTSLDRVRAQTASMRTTSDLESITPLIWHELSILGVPFTRCGVFIMDETHQQIHTFLSTPDGKAIAAFHLPYNTPGTISKVLEHWQKKEVYKDHWDEAAFAEWTNSLVRLGAIASSEKYLSENKPTSLYLHFFPFAQGMLYVGGDSPLNDEETLVVQSLADAFSTAYARYEDFNKLEAAKQQVEKTVVDLKQAQAQLIQSEKMASLGELTAGIAHEIQNPLNFVTNFSEVNTELIDELQKELGTGNLDEAKVLATNIRENEEKIVLHGKRADTIVKGMLQHSRSSSGVREPTDINALADEYLRLAYHGLRAKDKSFNATMKTDFDESIGNINIIPQDIGRVILNLITNAFYAVSEKKKLQPIGFEPTVLVGTRKINDKVEVKVKDNGNGIPQKVLDKIFQPFFTTKPTGQGTGLGLSLSYDIIKAHGGELKVETREDEGAEFVIILPFN